MSVWEDRVAIDDLLHRYGDGVNQRDAKIWTDTWDEEAEWFLLGPDTIKGRPAILAAWKEAMQIYSLVTIFVTQGNVEIAGETATGRSYTSETGQLKDGRHVRVQGVYEDRYRKRDGEWRFSYRRFSIIDSEHFDKLGDAF